MSKGKEFEGLDIENMFAEAAGASENTNEGDPELVGKNKVKVEELKGPDKKTEEQLKPRGEATEKVKDIKKPIIKEDKKPVEKPKPLIKQKENINLSSVDVRVIGRVIEMKEILDSYSEKEKGFIKEYFQQSDGSTPEIIYAALTANQRGLDALNKIVVARGHSSAERAFYLMELSNSDIEAIYEQIDLLAVQLDSLDKVSDLNKIKICRMLENIIADMDNNVFLHINKLQDFTSHVLD